MKIIAVQGHSIKVHPFAQDKLDAVLNVYKQCEAIFKAIETEIRKGPQVNTILSRSKSIIPKQWNSDKGQKDFRQGV